MATLAIGAVGAAIGGAAIPGGFLGLSGAAIGFSVGSALASFLLRPKPEDIERQGPKIGDVSIQSSAYGGMIPTYYGAARVAGNMIWASSTREVTHVEEEEAGKGGGPKITTTTFTYFKSFAIALMDGEIEGVSRVWRDGELFLNFSDTADAETVIASQQLLDNFIVYKGTEIQEPDSVIESFEGSGNVEAYRGTAYVVFDNMELDRSSMNFTFEVLTAAGANYIVDTIDNPISDLTLGPITHYGNFNDAIGYQENPSATGSGTITTRRLKIGFNGDLIEDVTVSLDDVTGLGLMNFTASVRNTEEYVVHTGNAVVGSGRRAYIAKQKTEVNELGAVVPVPNEYVTPPNSLNSIIDTQLSDLDIRIAVLWDGRIYCVSFNTSRDHVIIAYDDPYHGAASVSYVHSDTTFDFNSLYINATGVYAILRKAAQNDTLYKLDHDLNVLKTWTLSHSTGTLAGSGNMAGLNVADMDNIIITDNTVDAYYIYSIDEADVVTSKASGNAGNGVDAPFSVQNMILYQDTWLGPGLSRQTILLSDVVTNICTRSGLTSGDIDVSALASDNVSHYGITTDMSGRAALQPLMTAYLFDAVESDWKIKFVKRGGTSIAAITDEQLGAHALEQDAPPIFPRERKDEAELPFSVTLQYVDLDFDYQPGTQESKRIVTDSKLSITSQLPVGLDKDEAKQLSEILLFTAWAERVSVSLQLGPEFYYLDPSDTVTVTIDSTTYTILIEQITIGDMVEATGVIQGTYTSSAVGGDGGTGQTTIDLLSDSQCTLLNIPGLRQQDNSVPAYYVVMKGNADSWPGGALYSSVDGFGYSSVTSVFVASNIGVATDTLPEVCANVWDNANTLNVNVNGTLSSADPLLVLSGSNAAAYGRPGRYEIIAYQNAVLESDGTYTLSGLLRGRLGTEHAMDSHVAGDEFITLSSNSARVIEHSNATINSARFYKCVTIRNFVDQAASQSFTPSAENLQPYSPHFFRGVLSTDDLIFNWARRDRIAGQALWSPPLSESTEEYELTFYDNTFTTLYSTKTATSETFTYLAADQTTDGIPGTTQIGVRIKQESSVVTSTHTAELLITTGSV